ncbi:MarR family transcriptional regulator [Apibacter raozihei]|uniref:MarR family winged helix-turn-helix transcriptional regulator n=1 Tax=Apibacter TaxID=1778601 RepID=UPI000FE2AA0E|nr:MULTISPECIES: MarR family transcriptional regulator [Apibacter]
MKEIPSINEQLCFPIYVISRQITTLYRPYLEKLGLTYPQYLVMLVLWETGTCCVKDIGERLWLDSGTLTPLLKRMEENGWISRSRCADDERIVLIHMTEKGINLKPLVSELPCILKKELSDEDGRLDDLRNQLNDLLSFISNKCKTKHNLIK